MAGYDGCLLCSTPFGITELDTDPIVERFPPRPVCSTPFGITELDTVPEVIGLAQQGVCSTPFGITELDTRLAERRGQRPRTLCSTPFGITELDTPGRPGGVPAHRVLNAFRHH